ncbi:hypothetical protein RF11_13779 [Thelohanellus kitauei]|uniref:ISXO2-like transposase domain-containing protein n=1 Tax=Thelohanellus kitauei TaxID=669202 RepID=A0A0C2N5T8_THEKT|nr:hypothetical protein RF11_13779 [Thelohanellus kitauei]
MCRKICVLKLFEFSVNPDFFLSGERVKIEIDEVKFGRKYHRGRCVKGVCVFGPFKAKLQKWIKPDIRHVRKSGTTVISDGWASYLVLDQIVYLHLMVNHSQTLVDPTIGAHTNTIKGNWKHARSHPYTFNGNKKMVVQKLSLEIFLSPEIPRRYFQPKI